MCIHTFRSVFPPNGQWPAPIGSWRVDYYPTFPFGIYTIYANLRNLRKLRYFRKARKLCYLREIHKTNLATFQLRFR